MESITVNQTGNGNITTQSECGCEHIRKYNQYYLSLMEYTFSATTSVGVNAFALG